MTHLIYPEDCLDPKRKIADGSVDLGIYDPPFGIGEADFDRHYKRDGSHVLDGYQEAPSDYGDWTRLWMSEAKRVLKPDGSMYVVIGHTMLRHVLNAAADLGLHEINHLLWKFNVGVHTTKKYVTSHYHVLYYSKSMTANPTFNPHCRFGSQERDETGSAALYRDLEDVFVINKEYARNEIKNQNKLPEELVRKLILYSSNQDDTVCDFFMGNFTTASVAVALGRHVCGYEINRTSFDYHMKKLAAVGYGSELDRLPPVQNITPLNQGKPISEDDKAAICLAYLDLKKQKQRNINAILQDQFGRGKFAIKNILDANLPRYQATNVLHIAELGD